MKRLSFIFLVVSMLSAFGATIYNFSADSIQLNSKQGISLSPLSPLAWLQDSGAYQTNIYYNASTGTNDIYTIPAGYNGAVIGVNLGTAGSSGNAKPFVKTNGNYYPLAAGASGFSSTGASGLTFQTGCFFFSETETIAVSSDQNGLNIHFTIGLIPTSFPLKLVKLYSLASGDNTVYTVPAGHRALPLNWSNTINPGADIQGCYLNNSSTTRTLTFYVIPNGDSKGSTTQFGSTTVNNGSAKFVGLPAMMQAGDSLVINLDAATDTQTFWLFALEYPNP